MKKLLVLMFLLAFSASPASADDKQTLTEFFKITTENYLEPISVSDVAVLVLKELNSVDNTITVADDAKRVSIYKNAQILKSYTKPADSDSKQWIKLIEKTIKEIKKLSPSIKEKEYDLLDTLLKGAASKLDSGSKYYTEYDTKKEDKIKHFYAKNMADDILYIKLKDFKENVAEDIKESIRDYTQGIILDLRGNKGGMLSEGIEVAKLFLDGGIVASSREIRSKTSNFYVSEEKDIFTGRPIVVLVDGGTASAAEVLAASLQDQGRAKVLGTQTYGKGTVQTVYKLPNNAYLALSTAYLYTPDNKKIDKQGIMPDICTSDLIKVDDDSKCPKQDKEQNVEDFDDALDLIKKYLDTK